MVQKIEPGAAAGSNSNFSRTQSEEIIKNLLFIPVSRVYHRILTLETFPNCLDIKQIQQAVKNKSFVSL